MGNLWKIIVGLLEPIVRAVTGGNVHKHEHHHYYEPTPPGRDHDGDDGAARNHVVLVSRQKHYRPIVRLPGDGPARSDPVDSSFSVLAWLPFIGDVIDGFSGARHRDEQRVDRASERLSGAVLGASVGAAFGWFVPVPFVGPMAGAYVGRYIAASM